MGNRLSKIVTRTGDTGTTGLGDGSRVAKDSARIEAIGTVDELNTAIGLLRATPSLPDAISQCLLRIQHDLFDLGGELAVPGYSAVADKHVTALEAQVESFNESLPPLKEFVLPGGGEAAARCHLARAIARRAAADGYTLLSSPPPPRSSRRASGEKISFQPWCRSSGGRCAARTKRFAR